MPLTHCATPASAGRNSAVGVPLERFLHDRPKVRGDPILLFQL